MAKKAAKKSAGKKVRIVFETSQSGLARQVSKAVKKITKAKKRPKGIRPGAGGWDQAGGWLLDNSPPGPWGLQGGWTQGKDRPKRPPKRGSLIKPNPVRKNVRRALKRAKSSR